ncbi:MAG: DUF4340 domain-containing protein [Clostridiaceae bacterium]|nr:DUF4340 domain-containing protein [Clostridiaceae bacterium]
MKRRGILILYAAICGVLSLAAIIAMLATRNESAVETEPVSAVTAFKNAVTSIQLTRAGETVTLSTSGDVWTLDGDGTIPVNGTRIEKMASLASNLTAIRSFAAADGSLSDYGLTDAGISVTASNLAGEQATFRIGYETSAGDARYVLKGNTVYTVDTELCAAFDYGFLDLLAYDAMPDILPSELSSLYVERDGFELELLYDETDAYPAYEAIFDWYVGRPYDTPIPADTRNAHALFYDVTGLYFYGCAAYRPADYAAFGLDNPLCTVAVEYTDEAGTVQSVHLNFGSVTDDGFIYARFDGSNQVLLANAAIAQQIAYAVPSDLLPRQVCGILLETVTHMTVTLDGAVRSFEGDALEDTAFVSFYDTLTAIVASDTAPDTALSGDPYFTITFERSTDHDSEMTLSYYLYDDAYYLAVFNGRKNQLVDRYALDEALELYTAIS